MSMDEDAPDPRVLHIAGVLMNEFDMRMGAGAAKCRNAARDIVESLSKFDAEQASYSELRAHWNAFCDADPFEGADTFADRMEAHGLIQLRAVTVHDLEESFAAERGIEKGGSIWVLTKKGRAVVTSGKQS